MNKLRNTNIAEIINQIHAEGIEIELFAYLANDINDRIEHLEEEKDKYKSRLRIINKINKGKDESIDVLSEL